MRIIKPSCRFLSSLATLAAVALLWCGFVPTVHGQQDDPVENLRQLIKKEAPDLGVRRTSLDAAQQKLLSTNDLRLALDLTEWKDAAKTPTELSKIDKDIRTKIGKRLEAMLQADMASGDRTRQIMVAILLGEMGSTIRPLDPDSKSSFASTLAPNLETLMKGNDPIVSQAAARALGKINPDAKSAVPALEEMLKPARPVEDRRAAAEALTNLVGTIAKLEKKNRAILGGGNIMEEDLLQCATEAVPAAGACLKDTDVRVRRSGLETLVKATTALNELIPNPVEASTMPNSGEKWTEEQKDKVLKARAKNAQEWALLEPLLRVLKAQDANLAATLDDRDTEVSLLSRKILELLGNSRQRLLRLQEGVPTAEGETPTRWPDLLLDTVKPSLTKASQRQDDPNPEVRRATVRFLEALEFDAAPVVDALIAALSDRDLFVRWPAARSLGKIGLDKKNRPEQSEKTVLALAALLHPGEDPDVRAVVATTLREFGPDAKSALPALVKLLNVGEAESQEEVIKAITTIGGTQNAIKALIVSLDSRSANVRRLAAVALGSMGARAGEAVDPLLRHQQDDDPGVRLAISDAVLNILRQ